MNFEIENQDFKKVFEYSPLGMAIIDLKGKYLEVNLALCKLLEYENFQLIEMESKDIIYEEDLEQYERYIDLLEQNKIENFEMDTRCRKKSGVLIWIQLSVAIVKRENNFTYFIVNIQDITDKKEAKFELLLKKMELEELNQNLEQFTYFVSHDLQEPLRNINKLITELKKYEKFKENEIIKSLDTYSKRMKSFISDLLIYSQAGKKLKLNYIDCNIVLDRVLENLNVLIKEHKAIITFDYLPDINFNALRLEQIFQNLISNAIKYKKENEKPKIHIECLEEREFWKFIVTDNGIGIEKDYFQQIFQVFNRGYQEYQYSGSGIGLAVCKKVIEQHGGKIWLESKLNYGTSFFFTIPYT